MALTSCTHKSPSTKLYKKAYILTGVGEWCDGAG